MGFKNIVVGAAIVAMFTFALMGFAVQLADENNVNNTILNNEAINSSYENLTLEIKDLKTSSETQEGSWFQDIPVLGDASVIFQSTTGITRAFFSGFVEIYKLLLTMIGEVVPVPTVILNGIVAVILITTLLGLWSLFRSGK